MKRIYILIGAIGLAVGSALAQQQPAASPATAKPNPNLTTAAQRPEWVRMNIKFEGGTPDKLLATINKASSQPPNVIIHPDAARVRFPAFELHDVSATQIFIALNTLGEPNYPNGFWQQAPLPDGEIWTLTMQKTSSQRIDPLTGAPTGPAMVRNCKVLNLTAALGDYTVDDVTTAMHGAWELLESSEPPMVKFHKDTNLLIIVGDDRQLQVANDVLRELMSNVIQKKRASEQPRKESEPKKQ